MKYIIIIGIFLILLFFIVSIFYILFIVIRYDKFDVEYIKLVE